MKRHTAHDRLLALKLQGATHLARVMETHPNDAVRLKAAMALARLAIPNIKPDEADELEDQLPATPISVTPTTVRVSATRGPTSAARADSTPAPAPAPTGPPAPNPEPAAASSRNLVDEAKALIAELHRPLTYTPAQHASARRDPDKQPGARASPYVASVATQTTT